MNRDEAYRIVQKASRAAIEQRRNFREVVESDEEVALSDAAITRAFDSDRLLTHRRRILESLSWRP
jgi:adenylosuccinate lyase